VYGLSNSQTHTQEGEDLEFSLVDAASSVVRLVALQQEPL
jgi:hypothetical protein